MVTIRDFRIWQKEHTNFMTPDIIKVKQIGNYFVELSEGRGILNEQLYGVSIIFYNNEFKTGCDLSKSFDTVVKAENYFNEVCNKKNIDLSLAEMCNGLKWK